MSDIQQYTDFIIDFVDPLVKATDSPESAKTLIVELGYNAPSDAEVFDELGLIIQDVFTLVESLDELIESGGDEDKLLEILLELFVTIGKTVGHLVDFNNKLQSGYGGSAILTDTDILSELPIRLVDKLIISYLEDHLSQVYSLMLFLGVIEEEYVDENLPHIPAHLKRRMVWERLPLFFTDPLKILKDSFIDGDVIKFRNLIFILQHIGSTLGTFAEVNVPEPATLDAFNDFDTTSLSNFEDLKYLRFPLTSDPFIDLALELYPILNQSTEEITGIGTGISLGGQLTIPLGDSFELVLDFSAGLNNSLGFTIDKDGNLSFKSDIFSSPETLLAQTPIQVKIKFKSINDEDSGKMLSLGNPEGSHFEIGRGSIAFELEKQELDASLAIELDLEDGLLGIDLGGGDGFVNNISRGNNIKGNFNLGIGISNTRGFYFKGGSGLEISLPIHIELGPIEIHSLTIGLIFNNNKLPLTIAGTIGANLGALKAVVENIGLKAEFEFPPNRDGNLGPIHASLGFKPPNGVGLSIDAGVIKGGGYLYFDHDREEYAGALELVFSEWIALKAIGLITTRLPDGSKGFSMLIIITAEFGSGIQLGFGFTLLGVGGLLGLNRTVKIQPLAEGVRTGAVESVMFPQNVVANAPKIISDLRQFFPPANEGFLVGPMAKIGWGTPTLVSVSLGIILEFPNFAITILGVVKVGLPTEQIAVLKIQVNFVGRFEPSNSLMWFFAELYDSRILFITLEGGMGLLVNWGDNANFVLTVGGFHPRYTVPALPFPVPKRLAVNILNTSVAKIRIEGYFAVTSNSVQFGARAEAYFGFSAFKVEGHISFDVLFQFNPFYFIFEFSVGMSVKVFGFGLFNFSVSGLLEGPTKWHIKGHAKKKLTWFGPTIKIPIDKTWGEERQTELPPIEVFPLIEKEFAAITNWEAVVPKGSSLLVTLRKLGESTPGTADETAMDTRPLVLHPVGTLRISQRKLPLKLKLEKVGNQRPVDANKLSVTAAITGGSTLAIQDTKEKFATGEFRNLDNSKKLSTPGFEKYDSGLVVKPEGEQLKTSMAVKRIIRYETIIIDNDFKRHLVKFYEVLHVTFSTLYSSLFRHFLNGNSVTKSTLSLHYKKQLQPNETVIKVESNQYTVAFNDTNKPINETATQFTSQASAIDYMQEQISQDPNAAYRMHVIPNTEVNVA